jgi:hypothetical protein
MKGFTAFLGARNPTLEEPKTRGETVPQVPAGFLHNGGSL